MHKVYADRISCPPCRFAGYWFVRQDAFWKTSLLFLITKGDFFLLKTYYGYYMKILKSFYGYYM